MTTSADLTALRKRITSHMPVLDKRVRKREVNAVTAEAYARGDVTSAGFLQLAHDYAAQSSQRMDQHKALRTAHGRAKTAQERTALIAEALHKEHAPRRAFAALRRGWLDIDAMAERAELDRHELTVKRSIALRAAAALTETRTDRTMLYALLDQLLGDLPTLCAVACAEALTELMSRAVEWPEAVDQDGRWQALCARFLEPGLPRRVRAAFLRLCLEATPHFAVDHLSTMLEQKTGDDFVLRQHVIVLLSKRTEDPAAFALIKEHALRGDISEHVRLALPNALRTTGKAAAVQILEAMAGARRDVLEADKSPRVRAAIAIALADLLRTGECDTTAALAYLVADADPLVFRIVSEEIEDLAAQHKLSAQQTESLRVAFLEHHDSMTDDSLSESTLRTLEVLATADDPVFAAAEAELTPQLAALPEGGIVYVQTKVAPLVLGRLLARLARDGFGYSAWPVDGGYAVERGVRFVRRTWRILHELRNRTPYKRQDTLHTVGRRVRGTLRAPSGLLAEATHTSVPGETLASPRNMSAGAQLPTVDDLLSLPILSNEQVMIFGNRGVTQIAPPQSLAIRLWNRLSLNFRYAKLAELRQLSIDPIDPSERNRYIETLEDLDIGVKLRPYSDDAPPTAMMRPRKKSRARTPPPAAWPGAAALFAMPAGLGDFAHYLTTPADNTLGQLGFAATLAAIYMLASNLHQREQIRASRAAIPLCIGGWGTRGKSGTERLKAAMLHAQEVNVLVKTTGCEAMFIHGVPGRKPTEVFIHRSYDKATIWEQRDLLSLAAQLKVDVFLWECMALSGPLVQVLSDDWMRDDLQTLTNAYPDHEEIQGPAGHDVARSIAGFIRSHGTTITSEEQMLPIINSEAQRRQTRLISIAARDNLLLAEDLLDRFPYREHPRNIALVRRLAIELGLDPDLATADMADHVVPDLGVLKAYPVAEHRGRKLIFVNGMSANERTGFMSNWQRTGCERHVDEPGRWVMTVVNNRFDRVARSQVFADILVRDAAAERHVLIGTNLSGLRGYVDTALTHFMPELRLFRDDDVSAQLPSLLEGRYQRIRHRLRIGAADPAVVLSELSNWLGGSDTGALRGEVTSALAAAVKWADADETLAAMIAKLSELPLTKSVAALQPERGEDLAHYVNRSIARRALIASLEQAATAALNNEPARKAITARQDRMYRDLFMEMVVTVEDAGASGDQIIDVIARSCPPGIEATVMGIQNIKGTGLDFVYRWIRFDEVSGLVERLKKAGAHEAHSIVEEIMTRSDFGMLDSALAVRAVKDAATRFKDDASTADFLTHSAERLEEIAQGRRAAIQSGPSKQRNSLVRGVEKALDSIDAVRRRWRADEILDAVIHREISHERAALESRKLVEREKKGWLRRHA